MLLYGLKSLIRSIRIVACECYFLYPKFNFLLIRDDDRIYWLFGMGSFFGRDFSHF